MVPTAPSPAGRRGCEGIALPTICCPPNTRVYLSADEAGETTGKYFVAGMFCTPEPDAWRDRIDAALPLHPFSLHFQKIGRKPEDPRYRASSAVLDLLNRRTDWYAHYLLIPRHLVATEYFDDQDQIEFNYWMAMLIQKRTLRQGHCYDVTIADRQRNHADGYLYKRLPERLAIRQVLEGAPHTEIGYRPAREDRLLQVGDLIASSVHQLVVPSLNPNKLALAQRVATMVRPKSGSARLSQRIYAWEWRPNPRAA